MICCHTWFVLYHTHEVTVHPDPRPSSSCTRCTCRVPLFFACDISMVSAGAGESTTDHLDLLDDNPIEQEDGYRSAHQNHQQPQQRAQNHGRHPPSSWEEQGGGDGGKNNSNPWYNDDGDGHDASAQWSRPGKGEERGFQESWEGDGEGGEGRAWKHEDLKQLLQVLTDIYVLAFLRPFPMEPPLLERVWFFSKRRTYILT